MRLLKRPILLVIALALVTGFLVQPLGAFRPVIPFVIGFVLFFSFLDLQLGVRDLARPELLITLLLSALVIPALAYFVFSLGLKPVYRAGLLLVALAPSGIIMLILAEFIAEKDIPLIISNFFATLFGAVIYMPLVVSWFLQADVEIDSLKMLWQAALLVLVPYFLAQLTRKSEGLVTPLREVKKYFVPAAVFVVISVSLANASSKLFWHFDLLHLCLAIFAIYLVQGGIAFVLGGWLWDVKRRNTLGLVASSRNIQFVLAVAILNFDELIIVPLIIGILFHHFTNMIWLTLLGKK